MMHAESCTLSRTPVWCTLSVLDPTAHPQSHARQGVCHAAFPISSGDVYFVGRAACSGDWSRSSTEREGTAQLHGSISFVTRRAAAAGTRWHTVRHDEWHPQFARSCVSTFAQRSTCVPSHL